MRIAYFNPPAYDLLTATLIEGLTQEGHEVVARFRSNYAGPPPDDLPREAADCDIVVLGAGNGTDVAGFKAVEHPRKIYVDGTDFQRNADIRGLGIKAVFKRELSTLAGPPAETRRHPLPLAIERRYLVADPAPTKDLALTFIAAMETNPLRESVQARLHRIDRPDVRTGTTRERSYDNVSSNFRATPNYHAALARSAMSIAVPGWGYDTARYWEILGAGAALMSWLPDIQIPEPFVDGETCVTFRSLSEFEDKVDHYLRHPEEVARIAAAGHAHAMRHHTTAARARCFVAAVTTAWDDDFRF